MGSASRFRTADRGVFTSQDIRQFEQADELAAVPMWIVTPRASREL